MLTNILLTLLIVLAFAIFGELVKIYEKLVVRTAGAKDEEKDDEKR